MWFVKNWRAGLSMLAVLVLSTVPLAAVTSAASVGPSSNGTVKTTAQAMIPAKGQVLLVRIPQTIDGTTDSSGYAVGQSVIYQTPGVGGYEIVPNPDIAWTPSTKQAYVANNRGKTDYNTFARAEGLTPASRGSNVVQPTTTNGLCTVSFANTDYFTADGGQAEANDGSSLTMDSNMYSPCYNYYLAENDYASWDPYTYAAYNSNPKPSPDGTELTVEFSYSGPDISGVTFSAPAGFGISVSGSTKTYSHTFTFNNWYGGWDGGSNASSATGCCITATFIDVTGYTLGSNGFYYSGWVKDGWPSSSGGVYQEDQ